MTTNIAPKTEYKPYLRPLAVNGYAMIISLGKAGKIGNKYRNDGRTTWGIDWAEEYTSSELSRLTPVEFHALPEEQKISKENRGY